MSHDAPLAKLPPRFLIVDDHAEFRRMIRAFLPAGQITECQDGREVLERYAADGPDWVLMDIEMPGLDGLTAMRQLKSRYPEARVIIVSHHADHEFRRAAGESGACGFVHKEHLEQLPPLLAAGETQ